MEAFQIKQQFTQLNQCTYTFESIHTIINLRMNIGCNVQTPGPNIRHLLNPLDSHYRLPLSFEYS
jgi:hypothetical protein